MSKKFSIFCASVTSFITLSAIGVPSVLGAVPSLSTAQLRPSSIVQLAQANQVNGQGFSNVGAGPRGVDRTYSGASEANAQSPTNATTNGQTNLITNTTKLEVNANSGSNAGPALQGNGSSTSNIVGNPTGGATATSQTAAEVKNATTGTVNAGSSSSLNSATGRGNATGFYNYNGTR